MQKCKARNVWIGGSGNGCFRLFFEVIANKLFCTITYRCIFPMLLSYTLFSHIITPSHLNTLCLNLVHAVLFLTYFVPCSYIKRWCYLYQLERIRYFPKQRKWATFVPCVIYLFGHYAIISYFHFKGNSLKESWYIYS